jgi:hypothetical protein
MLLPKLSGALVSALDDPEFAVLVGRLNAEGRRTLLRIARALADDVKLRTRGKRRT